MAELYACAISELGGKFNTEMAEIYKKIKKEYLEEEISEEYIYELACKKISDGQSYLPIIHQERTKGIFGDIKVQTEFLKLENMKLQNQIIKSRGKSQFQTFSEQEDKKHQVIIPVAWENRKKA